MILKMQTTNSKLGKMAHFSTNCPFNCKYCYGKKARKQYKNVLENQNNNSKMLADGNELPDIPKSRNVCRMFSANGDFETVENVKQWIRLAKRFPNKTIYGYTKRWQTLEFIPELDKLRNMSNVVLRASIDDETGHNVPKGWTKAGILLDSTNTNEKHFICKSLKNKKLQCDKCKVCFLKRFENVPVYFPEH